MTLNEPNPVFKVTPLFEAEYFANGYRYGHSYYRSRGGSTLGPGGHRPPKYL